MPSFDTSLSVFFLSLLLGFSPGPDNVFVLMQSAANGRRAGFSVVLGLCCGLVVHTAAVAFGLATVFAASPAAFLLLKFVGASYLAYLAWKAWCTPVNTEWRQPVAQPNQWRMLARGVMMNLTNPKVLLFFLAFLPQFVTTDAGPVAVQLGWFGVLFILATLISFGLITCFAAWLGDRFRRSATAQTVLNRFTGVVFAGLAIRLALSRD